MTKRMIDADALLEKIHNTMQDIFSDSLVALPHKGILRDVSVEEILYCMQDYIEQIATPAPEPQESIFDADGWCWDMEKAPYNTRIWVLMENCNLKKYI